MISTYCSKHVEAYNKHTIKQEFVGQLLRSAGHVVRMEEKKNVYRVFHADSCLQAGIRMEYAGVVGRIILKQIIKEQDV